MGKTTIHCVRHAQGYHNLCVENHKLPDPSLTPYGEQQCQELAQSFPYATQITDLVASPLRRTIWTCLLSFPTAVNKGLKVIAVPELQETSDLPADTGSPREVLEKEFSADKVDLERVSSDWNSKVGRWSPAATAIEARAREARRFLRNLAQESQNPVNEQGDRDIVVVTHGGFLHYFTEDWEGNDRFTGTGWANTEWRSYRFVDESGRDEGASLVETRESRERRCGDEKPLSGDEQRNLRASAEKEWRESGFQASLDEEAKL